MQLILEKDRAINVKTMSGVESPIAGNISSVSTPSVNTTTLSIPVKESSDSEVLAESKNDGSPEHSDKTNGISQILSEKESGLLEEKENGQNIVETVCITDVCEKEKEDTKQIYHDKEKMKEQLNISGTGTVNGNGETEDQEEGIKKIKHDNAASHEKDQIVNTETKSSEIMSPKVILESSTKDMETDLDFSDDNDADSFEIKLDSSFEDLDDASKKTENIDILEKLDIAEHSYDQSENLSELSVYTTEKSEFIVKKTENIFQTGQYIIEKTEDIFDKSENHVEINTTDKSVAESEITAFNKPDTADKTETVKLAENVTKSDGDAQNNVFAQTQPTTNLVIGNKEISRQDDTDGKSSESKAVTDSATESMDTEKTVDKREKVTADCSVSESIQENVLEPFETEKEACNEEIVGSLDNKTIKEHSTEIKVIEKESLDEVQSIASKNDIEDSVISVDTNKLESKTDDKTAMEIDTDVLPNEAGSIKETNGGDKKQKDTKTCSTPKQNSQSSSSDVEIMDVDNDDFASKNKEETKELVDTDAPVKYKKRDSRINLDIFSDEEEDEPESKKEKPTTEKQFKVDTQPSVDTQTKLDTNKECVSLDDDDEDDDIMVIDDEAASKNNKKSEEDKVQEKIEESEKSPEIDSGDKPGSDNDDIVIATVPVGEDNTETPVESISETRKTIDRPLVASDFINNFKTKISEMTRADLEEFCLLKIVEGVVDRSNLSEIKDKLKQMMLNVEEWRKKTMVLNKQNRDLQIVLRTVQEEQKKRSDEMVTPLKITRSVGMQVLIGDGKADPLSRVRPNQKRPASVPVPPQRPSNPPLAPLPSVKPEPKTSKPPPIPVPRLVPAQSPTKPGPSKPSPLQNATVTSNTKNGIKTVAKGAEKRPLSDTVDLTDDEPIPPSKRPPVRLVPSNQLLAPRVPMVNKTGSPRQVYIPIGQQANIRPGQKISFKNPTSGPSPRGRIPEISALRTVTPRPVMPRGQHKHPAPLPQAYQQPQPPNWKALPPAPDLKISKIENGIVVSWKIDGYQEDSYEEIVSYQLYAYQETSQPASTFLWNKIGDIKALPLPMACTLTQFIAGFKYYFAVRAVDVRSRLGPFSLPGSILLLNK